MFRLIDITIDIIFFSINWKNYFDRSILVISMTVLENETDIFPEVYFPIHALLVKNIHFHEMEGQIPAAALLRVWQQ